MSRRPERKVLADINVVPYIDVMLVLLVIFMITTPLLTQGVDVSLPQAHAKGLAEENRIPLVVSVNQQGQYFLNANDQPTAAIDEKELLTQVLAHEKLATRRNGQSRPVYVKGDQYVEYGKVVRAMTVLQQAGVEHVGLLTREPDNR